LLINTDGDKIAALVAKVFPDFIMHYKNPEYLAAHAIVCPNNQDAHAINDYTANLVLGDSVQYLSCDMISKSSEHILDFDIFYPTKFLNSISANSFPNHNLILKKGVIVMLLRNFNQAIGFL
jgi:ATP-dependent DNA helicase PIF1